MCNTRTQVNGTVPRGLQGGNASIIKKQVQQQFQRNAGETDPTKVRMSAVHSLQCKILLSNLGLTQIAEQKEAAIRGLSNYMFMEAQRMAKVQCWCIEWIVSAKSLC